MRLHPNFGRLYRRRIAQLSSALADPSIAEETRMLLRGLIERIAVTRGRDGRRVEIVGRITALIEAGLAADGGHKKAALDARTACSVEVVAGARNQRFLRLAESQIPRTGA